ncbi:MAG: leucine-rich repeat domain-containing protein, partial [Clostridiales bacterium]|nr:leucine-rich repeat domain-containing protein [Clostridiales bacterium]
MEGSMTLYTLQINDDVLEGFIPSKLNSKKFQKTVILPEGITTIGIRAMKGFKCEHLVMPASLTTIKSKAFYSSDINEIDFSRCKLQTIDDYAFDACKTKIKATLPDTVESLGKMSAQGLDLAIGNKLVLPRALRYIRGLAVDLKDIQVLEAEERMVARKSGFEDLLMYRQRIDRHGKGLTLNVRRNGALVYRIQLPLFLEYSSKADRFIGEESFDCSTIDHWYEKSTNGQFKGINGAFRVMFPEGLTAETIKAYRHTVTANIPAMMEGFEEDIEI